MKDRKERLTYTFNAFGHANILATHVKTLEFTKDSDLTTNGDCIVGVNADFELEKLKQFSKKAKLVIQLVRSQELLSQEFKFTINPDFNSAHEIVLRKSMFNSPRTYGFNLNHGASKLRRDIVKELKKNIRFQVIVKEGWYSSLSDE